MSKQVDWPYVINLGNSIIGVSILAMPFCFKQCGILLGTILLLSCAYLTQVSCSLLMKGAFTAKRRSYEFLALFAFGPAGKLAVEISLIGLLIGTCVAFHVVIGDLGPAIISRMLAIENSSELRTFIMVFLGLFVALPLGLLRNVESLSNISAISLGFYMVFVTEVLTAAFPNLWSGIWVTKVQLWVPEGIFKCIPIFSLAFGCQSQLFIMYDALPEPSLKRMNSISKNAISLCTTLYLAVGYFGYVAFCDEDLSGDILLNFRPTIFSEAVKLGFCLAVAVSFPLVIFPCRAAIHTLLFARTGIHDNFSGTFIIPEPHFKLITLSIVLFTLVVGIATPNIEFVLALTGATMGSMICYIFPAVLFINLMSLSKTGSKFSAQIVLFIGVTLLLASTYMTLYDQDRRSRDDSVVKIAPPPPLVVNAGADVGSLLDKPLDLENVDANQEKEGDDLRLDTGQDGDGVPKDLDSKLAEKKEDVGKDDYRREPPNPHAPDEVPVKIPPEEKEPPKEKKSEEQEVVKAEDTKPKEDVKIRANETVVRDNKVKVTEAKEDSKAEVDDIEDKAKELEEKRLEDEKDIELRRKEAQADADEAKGILKELERQREEQKALIEEQKQIIDELRQHHIDDHIAEDAKKVAAEDAARDVLQQVLQQQADQQLVQQQQQQQQQVGQGVVVQQAGQQAGAQPAAQYAAQQPVQQGLPNQPVQQGLPNQPVQQGLPNQPVQQGLPNQPLQQGLPNQPAIPQEPRAAGLPLQADSGSIQQQGLPPAQPPQHPLKVEQPQQQQPVQVQQQAQQQLQQQQQQQPVMMQQQDVQVAKQQPPIQGQQQAVPQAQQQQRLQQPGQIQQQGVPLVQQQQQQQQQPLGQQQQQPLGQQQQQQPSGQQQQPKPDGHHNQVLQQPQAQQLQEQDIVHEQKVPAVQHLPGQVDFAQQHFQQQQHPEQVQQHIPPAPQQNIVPLQQHAEAAVKQQAVNPIQNAVGNNIKVDRDLNGQSVDDAKLNAVNPAAVEHPPAKAPQADSIEQPVQLSDQRNLNINDPNQHNDKDPPPSHLTGKQAFLNVDVSGKNAAYTNRQNSKKHRTGGG